MIKFGKFIRLNIDLEDGGFREVMRGGRRDRIYCFGGFGGLCLAEFSFPPSEFP